MNHTNEDASIQQWNEQESFIRDLIIQYKNQPVLWDRKHPKYRSRSERQEAYGVIINKCKQYYPEADVDFVRSKIDSMRSTFRREYRKVKASKAIAPSPKEVYKPSLWYYNSLMFTAPTRGDAVDEDDRHEEEDVPIPEKETLAPTVARRSKSSSSSSEEDHQENSEARRSKSSSSSSEEDHQENSEARRSKSSSSSSEEDHQENCEAIKIETDFSASSDSVAKVTQHNDTDNDDLFDTIAKNVAHKLRDMTGSQRNIAERIMKDVMYHGLMENLTAQSRLVLDGA